ncbi:hypothetical protein GGTG_04911 [Gaeumannomyces tritici R3-111a-1]|uniref:Uncharacterized protein n=1 Tax=Gaeumannomyces tritici (strain R3-111a-1) TaxID=644352 RepID=J3NUF5_GAET3|nr:hypothetical protein GGTG_04911 [Gaeumannomyces tritici R3-111a-1]EJT79828.1 hypothetical protein GGTG_04911 [Gaeumannomyces tritici R3-111a-1]
MGCPRGGWQPAMRQRQAAVAESAELVRKRVKPCQAGRDRRREVVPDGLDQATRPFRGDVDLEEHEKLCRPPMPEAAESSNAPTAHDYEGVFKPGRITRGLACRGSIKRCRQRAVAQSCACRMNSKRRGRWMDAPGRGAEILRERESQTAATQLPGHRQAEPTRFLGQVLRAAEERFHFGRCQASSAIRASQGLLQALAPRTRYLGDWNHGSALPGWGGENKTTSAGGHGQPGAEDAPCPPATATSSSEAEGPMTLCHAHAPKECVPLGWIACLPRIPTAAEAASRLASALPAGRPSRLSLLCSPRTTEPPVAWLGAALDPCGLARGVLGKGRRESDRNSKDLADTMVWSEAGGIKAETETASREKGI